ncbi:MAG: hypothetical protein SOZ92_00670 [Porphyromonas somerae]|nr:hypothetical protein [Porphyromonas somerae]
MALRVLTEGYLNGTLSDALAGGTLSVVPYRTSRTSQTSRTRHRFSDLSDKVPAIKTPPMR